MRSKQWLVLKIFQNRKGLIKIFTIFIKAPQSSSGKFHNDSAQSGKKKQKPDWSMRLVP